MKIFGYEITVKKKKKKRTGYSRKQCAASETNTALRMRSEGKSTEEIAKHLGRTKQAVNSRLWKVRKTKGE